VIRSADAQKNRRGSAAEFKTAESLPVAGTTNLVLELQALTKRAGITITA
jgi:hypothetical protein